MNQAIQQDLLKRACAALSTGRPDMGPDVTRSPVRRYLEAQRFAEERKVVRRFPQPVAAASALRNAGDWLARDMGGVPVLIVRDGHGVLRAFLNVCRHRGMQLAPCGGGQGKTDFVCRYHSWRYGTNGSLLNTPKEFGFPGLQKDLHGLRPLAVAERAGLIWVVPDPAHNEANVSTMLGPLADEIEGFGFATHVGYAPRAFDVEANWKILADGSLEDYHFQALHQKTSGPFFVDTMQLVDEFGKNMRFFLIKKHLRRFPRAELDGKDIREFGNILYFFFPTTWFLVQPDHAMVTFINPIDIARTRLEEIALLPEAPTDAEQSYWDENVDLFRKTLDEDYVLAERIHAALDCGANEHFTFGRFENGLARFHHHLEQELGRAGAVIET